LHADYPSARLDDQLADEQQRREQAEEQLKTVQVTAEADEPESLPLGASDEPLSAS
jgi:hypothetical protein